jgi:hypothetical protein
LENLNPYVILSHYVIPAQAGIHVAAEILFDKQRWIPACAGMTDYGAHQTA